MAMPLVSPTQYTLNVYNVHVLVHVLVLNKHLNLIIKSTKTCKRVRKWYSSRTSCREYPIPVWLNSPCVCLLRIFFWYISTWHLLPECQCIHSNSSLRIHIHWHKGCKCHAICCTHEYVSNYLLKDTCTCVLRIHINCEWIVFWFIRCMRWYIW